MNALDQFALIKKFKEVTPFIFSHFMTLATAPNTYGKWRAREAIRKQNDELAGYSSNEGVYSGDSNGDPEHPEYTQTFESFADWENKFLYFKMYALIVSTNYCI